VTRRRLERTFARNSSSLLAAAFKTAWETIKKSGSPLAADGQASSTRELLEKRIIERAQVGELASKRLIDDALAHLTGCNCPAVNCYDACADEDMFECCDGTSL